MGGHLGHPNPVFLEVNLLLLLVEQALDFVIQGLVGQGDFFLSDVASLKLVLGLVC